MRHALREPGDQSFMTVALPSEISEGDTLELTLGGLATESGTVSVSQTIDPGETLSDSRDQPGGGSFGADE